MIALFILAIVVAWLTYRFNAPSSTQPVTIYYHLPDDKFCSGHHKWKLFQSLFDQQLYQEIKTNISSLPEGEVVNNLLSRGLFCSKCYFVSGTQNKAVNPDEFVLLLTKALNEIKQKQNEELSNENSR